MKDVIAVTKKRKKYKELLDIETTYITGMAEVAKVLTVIDLYSQYSWAISNADINIVGDLKLTEIEKYQRFISQI